MSDAEKTPPSSTIVLLQGKGWKAHVPTALILVALGVSKATSHDAEVLEQVKSLSAKIDRANERVQALEVKLARFEGARGRGSSDD